MSFAVWRLKLLYEYKLSTPNQWPFIPFLDKNSVICTKITCEIHAYHIDMGGPVTFDSRINAFHISGVTEKYRENFPVKLTSKFIIFINEFTLSFNHTITDA